MGSGRTERSSSRRRSLLTKRACVRLTLRLVLLVSGAILNVAVAWGLNLVPQNGARGGNTYLPDEDDLVWWRTHAPAGFPSRPAGIRESRSFGGQLVFLYEREVNATSKTLGSNVARFRYGWPSYSMESALWVNRKTSLVVEQNRNYVPPGWPLSGRWVSIEPIWRGFAINTVFYAFILWLLFAAPFASWGVRRRWRVKRGLCVKCAYDLRGRAPASDVCPECGWRATGGTPTP